MRGEDLPDILEKMTTALAHRGPNGQGFWIDEQCAIGLGHRRLAILDQSQAAAQPMLSTSGRFVLTYNGELYNFRALRRELEALGHPFRGTGDTEVILASIEQWGLFPAIKRFNGMFAFGLCDLHELELFLVRDRLGIKPLYYGKVGSDFLFASELRAFRAHPCFTTSVNLDAVELFLQYGYVPGTWCIENGIYKLPPGHVASFKYGSASTRAPETGIPQLFPPASLSRYWTIDPPLMRSNHGSQFEGQRFSSLLNSAVADALASDVPVGAFLSGGIDSSLVVAVIRQQLGHPLNTFSVKFSGNSYDESTFAAQIAKHLGTQHHELSLEQAPEGETITEILRTTDEPFGDPTLIPMTLLSQFARNYVTVVLSGDGGDELFGGYSRYAHAARIWRLRTFLLKLLSTHGLRLLTRSLSRTVQSRTLSYVLTSSGISIERLEKVIALLSTGSKQEFCMNLLKTPGAESLFRKDCKDRLTTWTTLPNLEFLELLLATDLLGYLPDDILTQADRSTMASGLELRPPLLDNQLVEYALALPLEFRALPFGKKNILRDALSQYIPRPLFDRPKHGFSVPIRQWLRGHLRGWAEQYLGPAAIERSSLLCPEKVRSIWAGHLSGKENREQLLWNVIALQRYVLESS